MRKGIRPVAAALVLAVCSASHPARAQQAPVEKMEKVEVTGSRLVSSDAESASPIAVIKAEDIRREGFQSIELVLGNYPQFFVDQGNRVSNGATGTATANLRALGAQRTLVLLNGRRLPPGNPFVLSPDLNQVPTALIQRIEILTGGASAIYGSDAIAGVVNFILNDHFEGVQGDVAYDFYNHQQKNAVAELVRARNYDLPGDKGMDGSSMSTSLTMGGNFPKDKGNASVSFRYFKSQALLQSERDYSACALSAANGVVACGGSDTSYPGRFINFGFFQADPSIQPRPTQSFTIDNPSGAIRTFMRPGDQYNFAPLNYYQRPQERYGFNALAKYELTADAKVYAEFGFHDDHTVAQIAPSGLFGVETLVRYENPLLSADWRSRLVFRNPDGTLGTGPGTTADVIIQRRNVDGGGRQDDLRHTSSREVIGLKGTVASHWDYDLFFQSGRVDYQERYAHDFSISRATRALDVVPDPVTGMAVCTSALNGTDRNCVPYNVWALNGVTSAALGYLEVPGMQRALTSQQVMGGTISANLGDYGIRLPGTRAAAEVALGVERRTEKLDFEVDTEFATGDLAGQGRPIRDVRGGFTVKEAFGEVRVPVFDVVNLNGSYRRSDYSTGVTTDTFGVGFNATPTRFVRVRGSYQRAVRAPDLNELFSPQYPSGYGLEAGDPCAGETPARSLADCQRTGVTAGSYGHIFESPFDGYPATAGGNPELKPETAKTYTLGLVLTPSKDLSITVDYFDIHIEDTISSIEGNVIFQQCIDTGAPFFCGFITRDPATGTLWLGRGNIVAINQNIGKTHVAGADIALNYRLKLPGGHHVAVEGLGTYLQKQTVEIYSGAAAVDCAGQFFSGCTLLPLPKWRHRLRATWQPPANFDLAATWRYIDSTKATDEVRINYGIPASLATQPAMSYLDLAGSWNVTRRITLRAGMNNVTDRDPPLALGLIPGAVNGNAFAQVYDVLGRHVFASVTARF